MSQPSLTPPAKNTTDLELEKLAAFFNEPEAFARWGQQGDYDGLSQVDTAIRAMREMLAPKTGPLKLDTDERVFFYEQDFYVLSNFSAFTLEWRGRHFATAEAAYQWEKFDPGVEGNGIIWSDIRNAISAHEAFKVAERHKDKVRPDWKDVRVGIMREILRAKAEQHEYVRRKLLATGTRELIENSWRDDFWGWGHNRDGANMLGKLWMEIRSELNRKALGAKDYASTITESTEGLTTGGKRLNPNGSYGEAAR